MGLETYLPKLFLAQSKNGVAMTVIFVKKEWISGRKDIIHWIHGIPTLTIRQVNSNFRN